MFAYDANMANHYIREWRKFRHLSLEKLSNRMESEPGVPLISYSQLARIERGDQEYRQDQLEAIAGALGVTPAQLLSHNPFMEGEVIDISKMLEAADSQKRQTIVAMIKAVINS